MGSTEVGKRKQPCLSQWDEINGALNLILHVENKRLHNWTTKPIQPKHWYLPQKTTQSNKPEDNLNSQYYKNLKTYILSTLR
jgi:hypothetical protein